MAVGHVTAAYGNPTWSLAIGTTVVWTTAAMTSASAAGGGGADVRCSLLVLGTVTSLLLWARQLQLAATAVNTTGDWIISIRPAMRASTFRAVSGYIGPA